MSQNHELTPLQKCNMVTPTIELFQMLFLTLLAVWPSSKVSSYSQFRQTTFKTKLSNFDPNPWSPHYRTLKNALFGLISSGEGKTRNGMWHGLRNDIIMRNVKYGKSRKEIKLLETAS